MSQRTFDELREAVQAAIRVNDANALLALATELDALTIPQAEALAHRARTWALIQRDNYQAAMEHGRSALALYETLGDNEGIAITLDNIGSVLHRTGEHAAALDHYQRSLALSEAAHRTRDVARTHGNIGNVLLDLGDYDTAMARYQRSLELYGELGDRNAAARITGSIGIIHYNQGAYPVALEHFQRAAGMHGDEGDRSAFARTMGNIGNAYAALGDFATALEHYQRSVSIHLERNEPYNATIVTANIGGVYFETGDYPAALECFRQALKTYEELGSRRGVAYVMVRIGILHLRTGHNDDAMEQFQRALELYEQLGERSHVAGVLHGIAEVHEGNGDHAEAIETFQRALTTFQDLGERFNAARTLSAMISLHLGRGDVENASALLDLFDEQRTESPYLLTVRETHRAYLHELEGDLDQAHATLLQALRIAEEHGIRPSVATVHQRLRDLAFKRNDLVGYVEHNNEYTRINEEINGKETATKLAMQAKQREIESRERETAKHLAVLHSTLPKEVADRVARGEVVNDHYENATVIFLDIVGFTELSSSLSSQEVIALLDDVFTQCDAICAMHGVTKIKTIGDSYMAVGFNVEGRASVVDSARCALEMSQIEYRIVNRESMGNGLEFRIGLHCGPVTAGVIGKERMQYDVWGDTVNIASRMESSGLPGRCHITRAVVEAIENHAIANREYRIEERGMIEVKGKGAMQTYWLEHAS